MSSDPTRHLPQAGAAEVDPQFQSQPVATATSTLGFRRLQRPCDRVGESSSSMSSGPSRHLPPPVVQPSAAGVDPQPQPVAPPAKPKMHRIRFINFMGRRAPIVYQDENGSCPLVTISNVLFLKNVISLKNPDASEVSQQELQSLITERLINSRSTVQDNGKDEKYVQNREQKIADVIDLLPHLATGLNVNVRFKKVDDFEITLERGIFDLLDIPLYHGWIVDPEEDEIATAIGSKSCDELRLGLSEFKSAKTIVRKKQLQQQQHSLFSQASWGRLTEQKKLMEKNPMRRGDCEEKEELTRVLNLSKSETIAATDGNVSCDNSCIHCLEDNATEHERQWQIIDDFLRTTASQLTSHGILSLKEELKERELCVFFRNDHFNTMLKYNGSLCLLASDQGYLSQPDLVWLKLEEVNGDSGFLTSNFTQFKAETSRNNLWNEQQDMMSTADYIAQFDNSSGKQLEFKRHPFSDKAPLTPEQSLHVDGYKGNASLDLHTLYPFGGKEARLFSLPVQLYQYLQPHQKQGLEWLWALHCSDMPGGIVADDMGLGKTLQTTTFLSGLLYSDIIKRVMIIAPLSVLDAWIYELTRSGLSQRIQQYNTSGETGLRIVEEEGGILLLSYTMYSNNHEKMIGLHDKKWDYIVLDEAHKTKNLDAAITTAVKKLKCNMKLLLTGTPLTRSLMDIFSLMEFIEVNILGDEKKFSKKYKCPVQLGLYFNSNAYDRDRCLQALAHCREKIAPYMLRRTKSILVESGALPCKKDDVVIWLKLTKLQVNLCTKLCNLYGDMFEPGNKPDKCSLAETKLYQIICNDPALLLRIKHDKGRGRTIRAMTNLIIASTNIKEALYKNIDSSCKLSFILDLVKELFEQAKFDRNLFEQNKQGEEKWETPKILIFSQFVSMLDSIEKFKSKTDGPTIFLLSARVGGEGLTLTAATKVIIVDPSWNISDDNQMADRVYRLGQKKDVIIYRLFTCGTVEEHAYKLQLIKGALAHAILDGKVCASVVKEEEKKVLSLPNGGYNSSETQKIIESVIGDNLQLDARDQMFLRTHPFVAGITNQNDVFTKAVTSLDLHYCGSSDDKDCTLKEKVAKDIRSGGQRMSGTWILRPQNNDAASSVPEEYSTRKIIRRIEIPKNMVGLVKGIDNNTLRDIGRRSSASILLDEDHGDPSSPFKSVRIMGTLKEFEKAKEIIQDIISKGDKSEAYLSVPKEKVGLVIGSQHRNLKEIKRICGAHVEYIHTQSKFRIRGPTKQAVDDAKAMMLNIVNKESKSTQSYHVHPQSSVRNSRFGYGGGPHGFQRSSLPGPPGHGIQLAPFYGSPGYGVQAPPHQGPPRIQPPPAQPTATAAAVEASLAGTSTTPRSSPPRRLGAMTTSRFRPRTPTSTT